MCFLGANLKVLAGLSLRNHFQVNKGVQNERFHSSQRIVDSDSKSSLTSLSTSGDAEVISHIRSPRWTSPKTSIQKKPEYRYPNTGICSSTSFAWAM